MPFGKKKQYVGVVTRLHDEQPKGYDVKEVLVAIDSEPIVTTQQLKFWQWIADYYMSSIGDVMKAALPAGLKAEEGYKPKTETYIRLTNEYRSEAAQHKALYSLTRAKKQYDALCCYLQLASEDEKNSVTREELLNTSHASAETVKHLIERGILELYEVEVGRLDYNGEYQPKNIRPLSEAQQQAYNKVLLSMMSHRVTLLHGVTSSGKTEIYIHLIQRALDRGEQVLYLLPEIALTVQMMQRLKHVFGDKLGIYHSKYSDAERVEIWRKQLSGHPYDVILGARSAIFLPFQNLGLVIVDEEHESSYKQQDPAPRYHARSAAIMLAQQAANGTSAYLNNPQSHPNVVLGTATPSMESYHNALTGKYGLAELNERYLGVEMPEIQIVDIQDLARRKMMSGPFSPILYTRVREALERGEQAILFQNRRGFAPMIICRTCGWVPRCQHCDVSLTLHRQMDRLTCHYCGNTYQIPTECPCCGNTELRTRGFGTEKIEEEVREVFPDARVARMDLDTTRTRNAHERIIDDFSSGNTDILIGTQMITKGLDFERVSVVGILNADAMLNMPDFRAYEHAYMMMAQVAGRAGRRNRRGLVILQTRQPTLHMLQHVVNNDYKSMYNMVLKERQDFIYPPFCRIIYIYLRHAKENIVQSASTEMAARLRHWFGNRLLGPDRPAVARVKSQSIRKMVLKLEPNIDMAKVRQYLNMEQEAIQDDKRYASLQVYYDVEV